VLEDTWKSTEDSFRAIINRINEVNVSKSTGELAAGGNIMIIDSAKPPPIRFSPRRVRNVAVAALAGLVLAAGLCLFLDYLDASIKSKEELEKVLGGVSVLGFVPRLSREGEETEAVSSSRSLIAESFRTIRTSLGLSYVGRQKRAFVVTSPDPGDGKTLSAFNLAVAFAHDNKRVLLMECDMRRPRLRKMFKGVQFARPADAPGLSKVLVQAAELAEVVCNYPELSSLDIAFCGAIPPNPAELLGGPRFQDVLKQALAQYDIVILDSPPVLSVADCTILAGFGLPVVFLVRAFKTDRHRAALAAEQIRNVQGTIVGAVINSSDAPHRGYYYAGYQYGGRYHYYHYHYRAGGSDSAGADASPKGQEG
jgi:non-specific protein-tyrosine kinase